MTRASVAYTDEPDSAAAGRILGEQIAEELDAEPPDALIVFASPHYDFAAFLPALEQSCRPAVMVGCSSAGEFTNRERGESAASAVAIRSDTMRFRAGLGRGIRTSRRAAAEQIVGDFAGARAAHAGFRTALVLTDALAGHADDLVEELTLQTRGRYQFVGGGAGDDARFARTTVFHRTEAHSDAAVALEILSQKPVGVGVRHGWEPAGPPMRVTEADGARLVSLNAIPARQVFEEHAAKTGQPFDPADPLPMFLHNVLGIETGAGYKLRVPLALNADGSITCAAEIPTGAAVHIMKAGASTSAEAAGEAARAAVAALGPHAPGVGLFFDCVATRLRSGRGFGFELEAIQEALAPAQYAGCNTYGQIARADGQFAGFHNCTAVVCILPA